MLCSDEAEELTEKLMSGLNRTDLDARLNIWTELAKIFVSTDYVATLHTAYDDLKEVNPNPFPMMPRDGPWLRTTFNGLRRDYTMLMTRWNVSGDLNPDAEVASFVHGLANPKALRLMFEVYDGHAMADYANRTLADDAAVDAGVDSDLSDDPLTSPSSRAATSSQSSSRSSPPAIRRSPRLVVGLAKEKPAAAAPAAAATGERKRRRESVARPRRSNPNKRSKSEMQRRFEEGRADKAMERIAAAKEDAAKSAKFGVLLSNRDQLTAPQRAAVAAIADTFIDSFLPARPHPADTDDDDDLNPPGATNMPGSRWEPLPTSESDAEGSHGEEGF